MIDPVSMGDWVQATVMVGALGGLAAACGWVIRQVELAAGSRATMGWVPTAAAGALPSEQARRVGVGGDRG